ncbi:hypothetical protein F2P81_018919 [Scophthalmus maximus]|uniref:Uncharacterized protein n=1 Tax=Scophthalmus maximus TaxID=52904 RepID=A0A6A4SFX6_SCOMX|nr:hypothetical protein F2P81_018919 [Scophthalmus maximus]
MSADGTLSTETSDDNKLVRPKVEFGSLLRHAGATKDVFTVKEVMFYLGQYIIKKQLYDEKQQHIVHCSQDALGHVLGVDSFSVKEPRVLFEMITKNLVAVKSQAGPSHSGEDDDEEEKESEESEDEEEGEGGRKRRRSDSYSLTFDESLSWCVIGGLGSGRDRHSSQSSETHSNSGRSEVAAPPSDSDSDNFSVEFEVESVDSDDYNEDDVSLTADDQVYEVTIFEAEDDDSFDEDTEISEADYWRCAKCDELNPPLPRNCFRCWTLRQDWLPDVSLGVPDSAPSVPKALPTKPANQSAAKEASGPDVEENEGVDVPDGKRAKTPPLTQCLSDSAPSAPSSQDLLCFSQPSSSSSFVDSQETSLTCSPAAPELERSVSAEWRMPESCLDPCLICQSRPKNGSIVHGRTGHLMACYVCARKLKKRNKLCPVCRRPIEDVVLTYFS